MRALAFGCVGMFATKYEKSVNLSTAGLRFPPLFGRLFSYLSLALRREFLRPRRAAFLAERLRGRVLAVVGAEIFRLYRLWRCA
ncbi:MAG: hypothetical protein WCF20_07735 [Methylovirgula sp.]